MEYFVINSRKNVMFYGTEEKICENYEKDYGYKRFYKDRPDNTKTRFEKVKWFLWIYYDFMVVTSAKLQEGGM